MKFAEKKQSKEVWVWIAEEWKVRWGVKTEGAGGVEGEGKEKAKEKKRKKEMVKIGSRYRERWQEYI